MAKRRIKRVKKRKIIILGTLKLSQYSLKFAYRTTRSTLRFLKRTYDKTPPNIRKKALCGFVAASIFLGSNYFDKHDSAHETFEKIKPKDDTPICLAYQYKRYQIDKKKPVTHSSNLTKSDSRSKYHMFDGSITAQFTVDENLNIAPVNGNALVNTSSQNIDRNNKIDEVMINNFDNIKGIKNIRENTKELLTSDENKQKFIDNLLTLVDKNGYNGVNIDFEMIQDGLREDYTDFLKQLKDKFSEKNLSVSVSVPPKWDEKVNYGYDYAGILKNCDRMIIMNYNQHYSGSKPGPIASHDWTKRNLDYVSSIAKSPEDKDKVVFGFANYGTVWHEGRRGYSMSVQEIQKLINQLGCQHYKWNEKTQTPYVEYYSSKNGHTVIHYENGKSISDKIDLVNQYDMGGVAIWALGQESKKYLAALDKAFAKEDEVTKVATKEDENDKFNISQFAQNNIIHPLGGTIKDYVIDPSQDAIQKTVIEPSKEKISEVYGNIQDKVTGEEYKNKKDAETVAMMNKIKKNIKNHSKEKEREL